MFNNGSPKKRKNDVLPEKPTCSKRLRQNSGTETDTPVDALRTQKIREIVNREFVHEMKSKEQQLDQIDARLDVANNFLNRLRYAIVAEYYKKQEQPQLMAEATKVLQNTSTSLPNNDANQIAMHPSLKKIIGKRPTNLADIMKVCPKRAAAQNAKYGICTKSAAKRKEERQREKLIREQGVVIDHTKNKLETSCTSTESNDNPSLNANRQETSSTHTLNTCRVGSKSKYLFVVGNTSKYISNADSQVLDNVSLTHKWLVYVQTKDSTMPIAKYIKKVRFFLHPSYRPNDIIDVHQPPFQVARRGWGEFPMRIQLFFHDRFQQKPVQLIHRVVLDTSKSGRHTLGAETVMEVWLRDETSTFHKLAERDRLISPSKNAANSSLPASNLKAENATSTTISPSKSRTISLATIKEPFDDNFFDFLNKIEETRTSICADIEKIQPTVVVNEPLEPQLANVHGSPNIKNVQCSPLKRTPTQLSPYRTRAASANAQNKALQTKSHVAPLVPNTIKDAHTKLQLIINQVEAVKGNLEISKEGEKIKPINILSTTTATVMVSSSNISRISSNVKSITTPSPSGKVFSNISGTVILPVTKPQQAAIQQSKNMLASSAISSLPASSVFQKKIIQVIDAQGKIKTVQILVATPKTLPSNIAPQMSSTISSTNQVTETLNAKNATPLVTNLVSAKPFIIKTSANLSKTSLVTAMPATLATTAATQEICATKQQPTANNLNNVKSAAISSSKKVVFQKEGKLYIIDPMQMKLKQQQKNQVSLLKPQIKQQQQTQTQSSIITTIATDHDYVPLPQKPQINISRTKSTEATSTAAAATSTASLLRSAQLQLGTRNSQLNMLRSQDLLKLRKIQFEKRFFRIKFSSMRSAVEYLLRRLPLNVFDKDSPAATFPFVCTAPQEFRSLTAYKQRSCEWLRAKFIARLLRNLQTLQQLDANKEESFWSTREIATFARHFAYTPPIKPFSAGSISSAAITNDADDTKITAPGSREHISALVKTELQSEELQVEYDSLSTSTGMQTWIERMQQKLQQNQNLFADEEIIVIDSGDESAGATETTDGPKSSQKDAVTKRIFGSPLKLDNADTKISYLPPLARLETASQFVGETCKNFSIRLQPEEIMPGIVHPTAQTLLAHVLKVFVDRLLRQTIAHEAHQTHEQQHAISASSSNTADRCITAQDLRKTIIDSNELDFLTNRHLGVSAHQIKHE